VKNKALHVASALGLAVIFGCAKSKQEPVAAPSSRSGKSTGPSLPALADVHESVQKGAYDDAAKRLLELRAAGHEFSPREAADYRRALDEAYTRALEAAEKGDTRAQEAIAIIRAGHPH
jgi:hypothetical protein